MKPIDLSRDNDIGDTITVVSTSRHSSNATPFENLPGWLRRYQR